MLVDFRSDTLTRPTAPMRAAMAQAEVGDDVLDGDPTTRALEERVAALLGKAGALFVPSGTMANQVAIGAWTRPAEELIAERSAHLVCWEGGATAALHGVQTRLIAAEDGVLRTEDLERALRPKSLHCPRTALVCVEQTYMGSGDAAGGRVVPLEALQAIYAWAQAQKLPVHMDGARLWNASAASGLDLVHYGRCADSISVCLSKGLGAPVGSLIAGDAAFLERARSVRKRLGGMMRQSGILAAAGLYAIEHHRARLVEDHRLAREVARVLHESGAFETPPEEVETNLVMARVRGTTRDAAAWSAALRAQGVLALPQNPRCLRLVTHMDLASDAPVALARALSKILNESKP
jgi:threonine aldolase